MKKHNKILALCFIIVCSIIALLVRSNHIEAEEKRQQIINTDKDYNDGLLYIDQGDFDHA